MLQMQSLHFVNNSCEYLKFEILSVKTRNDYDKLKYQTEHVSISATSELQGGIKQGNQGIKTIALLNCWAITPCI